MEISIAQNVAGQIQELLQISCIFFANWFAFFLHFLHFNFSYKNGFAFFLAFFLHPDFWGSIFQLLFFAFFCIYILFYVSQKEAQPDHTSLSRTQPDTKSGLRIAIRLWSRDSAFRRVQTPIGPRVPGTAAFGAGRWSESQRIAEDSAASVRSLSQNGGTAPEPGYEVKVFSETSAAEWTSAISKGLKKLCPSHPTRGPCYMRLKSQVWRPRLRSASLT